MTQLRRYTKPDRAIYFMRRADGIGPIKIGCSAYPARRLQAISIWSPEPLALLAYVPGSPADERKYTFSFRRAVFITNGSTPRPTCWFSSPRSSSKVTFLRAPRSWP